MKTILATCLALTLASCSHLPMNEPGDRDEEDLWNRAHLALANERFDAAAGLFGTLVDEYPDSQEGQESLFYLGVIHLDPRNPEWDPAPAESALESYVAIDSAGPEVSRVPEARMLLGLANQLNLPVEDRVAGLQPEPQVVTITERVVVPASQSRELAAQGGRLRAQLAVRDSTIEAQKAELERIRNTLKGPATGG